MAVIGNDNHFCLVTEPFRLRANFVNCRAASRRSLLFCVDSASAEYSVACTRRLLSFWFCGFCLFIFGSFRGFMVRAVAATTLNEIK